MFHLKTGPSAGSSLLRGLAATLASAVVLGAASASAAVSINWTSPPNGTTYLPGTAVTPLGLASATGSAGDIVELGLVMDSSGSMTTLEMVNGVNTSRQQAQKDALIAFVNSLPPSSTSVSVTEYDSNANVLQTLLPLTPLTNRDAIIAAINSVDAAGNTNIGAGIAEGANDLLTNGDLSNSQQLIVLSDGISVGNPAAAAANVVAAGIDNVNAVALPGANISTMQNIALWGNGTFIDATSDLGALVGLFTGGGSTPVGIDRVEVTTPDGTTTTVAVDILGNFASPVFNLVAGPNLFTATVFGTDGSMAQADLVLNAEIPLPAGAWLFLSGAAGMAALRRRRAKTDA